MLDRVRRLSAALAPRFPLFLERDGRWNTTADGNWCAGYWIGLQFLAAKHASSEALRRRLDDSARAGIERMRAQPTANIFAGLNHYVAGFWAADVIGDASLRELGLRGAQAMRDLYSPRMRQIPIGRVRLAPFDESNPEDAPLHDLMDVAAVDVIHTSLPVLWRATAETGDSSFADIATEHARRHLELHCRDEGSTIQMTRLDADGEPIERLNPLGDNLGSCWSRGLAWHIAGLAEAYVESGLAVFLDALEHSVGYLMRSSRGEIPSWDLDVPSGNRDSSAAAIIAYGLLRLVDRREGGERVTMLRAYGSQLLVLLIRQCLERSEASPARGGIEHGCYQHPQGVAVDTEVIWGDFYTAAALDLACAHSRVDPR
jgi:unsaturated chondroitin disaccharide hydrolase